MSGGIDTYESAQAGGLANIQSGSSMGIDSVSDNFDLTSESNDNDVYTPVRSFF